MAFRKDEQGVQPDQEHGATHVKLDQHVLDPTAPEAVQLLVTDEDSLLSVHDGKTPNEVAGVDAEANSGTVAVGDKSPQPAEEVFEPADQRAAVEAKTSSSKRSSRKSGSDSE